MEGWLPDTLECCVEDVGQRRVVTGSQHWWLPPDVGGVMYFREREKDCVFYYLPFASGVSQSAEMLLSSKRIALKALGRDEEGRGGEESWMGFQNTPSSKLPVHLWLNISTPASELIFNDFVWVVTLQKTSFLEGVRSYSTPEMTLSDLAFYVICVWRHRKPHTSTEAKS